MVIMNLGKSEGGDYLSDYCQVCEYHHLDGRCFKTIYLQCCEGCGIVEASYKWEPAEYYPVEHEWMEECFGGSFDYEHKRDQNIEIEYIGYCSVECELEHKGVEW